MDRNEPSRPNRILLDEAIAVFLTEMVPYVKQEVEASASLSPGAPAIDRYDRSVESNFMQDLQADELGYIDNQKALERINVTVDIHWPVFKKRLRNRSVMRSALTQIQYANSFTTQEAHEVDDLEPLYVEQRLDDMTNVLGRIGGSGVKRNNAGDEEGHYYRFRLMVG